MTALAEATHLALNAAGVPGKAVKSIALDTTGSSVIPVGDDLEPLGRLLSLVRPPGLERSAGDHRKGARIGPAGHQVVRRGLFVGVGFFQAAALAAAQSRQARSFCHGV